MAQSWPWDSQIAVKKNKNKKINRIHEGALGITLNDKPSSFIELLNKDTSVTIHCRNIRALAIET